MRNKLVTTSMLLVLLVSMLTLAFNIQPAFTLPATIIVPDDYPTIQEAVNAANPGDTIYVRAGTYYEEITIDKNNLTLIGENKHTTIIDGDGDTSPVVNVTNVNNVEISGFTIQNGAYGIYLYGSSNCSVSENNVTNNGYPSTLYGVHYGGISLDGSSDNIISGNNIRDNYYGVIIDDSSNFNTIFGNNVTNNDYVAIRLSYSSSNVLENNILDDNYHSIVVYGYKYSHYTHDINTSNIVDGKPVYYWINEQNKTVPSDAGYVGLVDCMNITVQNLNLANNGEGVLMAYTTNSTITQNNITNSISGIAVYDSSDNNTISGNDITNNSRGIFIYRSSDNTVYGNTITDNDDGVGIWQSSSFNVVSGNNITNNGEGIAIVQESNNNTVSGNTVTNNEYRGIGIASFSNYNIISGNNVVNHEYGIMLDLYSNHTNVYENTITASNIGLFLTDSWDNFVFHNNLLNNTVQAYVSSSNCTWDDGYPSGGNYWSDYPGLDSYGGPYQNETGSDGIGDIPYVVDDYNQDHYPLMKPFGPTKNVFNVTWDSETHPVTVVSNSTVSNFNFSQPLNQISFNVTGPTGTTGFCNITVPKELGDTFEVLVDGTPVSYTQTENATHYFLYFTYQHCTHIVTITLTPLYVQASMDIDPDTLNFESKGKWITAYIELPEGYDVNDIDVSTVRLDDTIPAELRPTEIGDYDNDGIPDLMVKFSRQDLIEVLSVGEATLTITGKVNETPFEGSDTIRVRGK